MEFLERKLRVTDITPFREQISYRIDVYQRNIREYCAKHALSLQQPCNGACKGLFLTTEAYDHGDRLGVDRGVTLMLVPPHGFINREIFLTGFGLPDLDAFEESLRMIQKDHSMQRILRPEIETDGGRAFYKIGSEVAGFRRHECGMENAFDFVDSFPKGFNPYKLASVSEAYATLSRIISSKAQVEKDKVEMTYHEKLLEASEIAAFPGGREFLYDRFDKNFINDVMSFMQNTQKKEKKPN